MNFKKGNSTKESNFLLRCNIYDAPLIQEKYHVLREETKRLCTSTITRHSPAPALRPSTVTYSNSPDNTRTTKFPRNGSRGSRRS